MPNALDLALSPTGQHLLTAASSLPETLSDRLGQRLRAAGYEADLVSAVLTQAQLRREAEAKLGPAAREMVFTRAGLEQATRLVVAAHHAQRFREAGIERVADLGCGLGIESLAMAGLGLRVVAIEKDPATARAAAHNLHPFPEAEVRVGDVTEIDLAELGVEAFFADPARRTAAGRALSPEQWSPPLSTVLDFTAQLPGGIKVAPGIDHALVPPASHTQWTSVDGEVVEAAIWTGPLAQPGPGRSALVIRSGQAHRFVVPDLADASAPNPQVEAASQLGEYIAEPDGALIRAGGVAALAERLDAAPVFAQIAYLTGDTLAPRELRPFVTQWRILEVASLKSKKLRAACREWGAGEVVIKKRGANIDPAKLRREILPKPFGTEKITLICTRLGNRRVALRVEPVGA
ncbi:MAG: SAM-dependent methyltransferase [Actinomycetaceae bacterium]|nr:SAM-dependent methyltransferase [Actinomycetaceae bacterium]MDU0970407.1 SAM-dependent methyltransferase [Actinomycetaceae bacterium]